MKITRLQQSLLIISVSITLTFIIQLKLYVFSRARAINVTRVIPEALITAGNKKYFTDEHSEQALLRIKNTTILDNLLITNNYGNAVAQVFVFAAILAFIVMAISKKGRLIDALGLFIAGLVATAVGYVYTYSWFQTNGQDFVQAGYNLRQPYLNVTFWDVVILAWAGSFVRRALMKEKEITYQENSHFEEVN